MVLRHAAQALEYATYRRRRAEEYLRVALAGADVRAGTTPGPVPVLEALLRLRRLEERGARTAVAAAVATHPAWPWLASVRGVGPIAAGRLLARLDVTRAETPSAFVAYCGLVPPPRARTGGGAGSAPAAYDRRARVACHVLARSWLRHGGEYADYYRAQRRRRDARCPSWSPARRRLSALRATEQVFLANLWTVWRRAVGLPVVARYAEARLGLPAFPGGEVSQAQAERHDAPGLPTGAHVGDGAPDEDLGETGTRR